MYERHPPAPRVLPKVPSHLLVVPPPPSHFTVKDGLHSLRIPLHPCLLTCPCRHRWEMPVSPRDALDVLVHMAGSHLRSWAASLVLGSV